MITFYGLSVDVVDNDGGKLLVIQADFTGEFGKAYNCHIGPTGTVADPKCLSGISGQGFNLYSITTRQMEVYLPRLPVGGPYDLLLRRVDNSNSGVLPAAITVLPAQYYSSVFDLRGLFPPYYRVGPRNLDLVDPT